MLVSQRLNSKVDIELFVGVTHGNRNAQDLRMLQWDGKESITDLTATYDQQRGIITGTTNKQTIKSFCSGENHQ